MIAWKALPGSRTEPSQIKAGRPRIPLVTWQASDETTASTGQLNAPIKLVDEYGSKGLLSVLEAGRLDLYEG